MATASAPEDLESPLLILDNHQHLSHPLFALKRLHLAAKNLLIFSRDSGDVLELMGQGFDGQIQKNLIPEAEQPGHYLLNLKRAHHSMEARGCWIPAVQALKQNNSAGRKPQERRIKSGWSKPQPGAKFVTSIMRQHRFGSIAGRAMADCATH